jgi:hypothetical protein
MKTSSDEIDKTLSSLDDLARANDNPFLFAKIQQRMQANANARSYPKSLASRWSEFGYDSTSTQYANTLE